MTPTIFAVSRSPSVSQNSEKTFLTYKQPPPPPWTIFSLNLTFVLTMSSSATITVTYHFPLYTWYYNRRLTSLSFFLSFFIIPMHSFSLSVYSGSGSVYCHICSPAITGIVLFNGLSVSNLWPSHQQPRGLCTLFVSAILFLCAQDCDLGAQSFILVCLTELGSSGENHDILCNFMPFNYYLLICFLFLAFSSNYLLLVLSLFT